MPSFQATCSRMQMPVSHLTVPIPICLQRGKRENGSWRLAGGEELAVPEGTCMGNRIKSRLLNPSIAVYKGKAYAWTNITG